MEKRLKKQRNFKFYIPLIIVILVVIGIGIYYYWQYLKYESTDDALIDCNSVALSSKMLGRIVKLYVDEGDSVKKDQLLVELDTTDLKASQQQAISNIAQMRTNIWQAEAKLMADQENIKVLEINLEKAQKDYERALVQKENDVISQENFENYRKAFQIAKAQLSVAQKQLQVTKNQIETAKAAVKTGIAQANVINTQIQNMRLYAPFDGVVAKRWLLPGDVAQPGQTILTINQFQKPWVSVYIEETKLKNIYLGQKAIFTIDAIPGITFTGHVFYIGNNTASKFSLIPPSNASGNFTKITQRVQLKVSIDSASSGRIQDYQLLTGMSVVIKLLKNKR